MAKRTRGLGKGLNALMPGEPIVSEAEKEATVRHLSIADLFPNPKQPRRDFSKESLEELSHSIREYGILQPILVVSRDLKFMIVAGERRYRAARLAGLTQVPCIVKELAESDILELALIENLQREDLTPIEEATAFKTLVETLQLNKADLARRVGKSRAYVSNMIRLLALPMVVQEMINQKRLTIGHARALININDQNTLFEFAHQIIDQGLSVRQTERLVQKYLAQKTTTKQQPESVNVEQLMVREFEDHFKRVLATNVRIKHGKKKGVIEIEYYGNEDLERLMAFISK